MKREGPACISDTPYHHGDNRTHPKNSVVYYNREYKKICQSRGHLASILPLESFQPGTRLAEAARSVVEGILRDLPYSVERVKKVAALFNSIRSHP